jgi:hypothetical protein
MSGNRHIAPIGMIYVMSAVLLFLLASSSTTTVGADGTRLLLPSSGETTGKAAR